MRHLHTALATLATLLAAGSAGADVLSLPAAKDNTIFQDDPSLSNGSGEHIFSGKNAIGNIRRALLTFDVAGSIPAGSTINSVTLRLVCNKTIAGPQDVGLFRLTQDWGEGASDAPGEEGPGALAAPGDATWANTFFPASNWTALGGDFVAASSATTSVAFNGAYTWTGAGLVADVQDMLDNPAGNFGWVLRHLNEVPNVTAKRFASRSNPTSGNRPQLTIDFDPPGGCVSSSFCSSGPNSTGSPALMGFSGSCVVADNALTLTAGPVPNQPGIFYYGVNQIAGGAGAPFGNGLRCVGGAGSQVYRLPVAFASGNVLSFTPDLTVPPGAGGLITAGSTWNFQAWFRDPAAGGAAFDLSDGLQITFQ